MSPAIPKSQPRIALLHDWLTGMRGGEKVLESFCRLWPKAEIHTLLSRPKQLSPLLRTRVVRHSILNCLPGVGSYYQRLLPLMPAAAKTMRLKPCDLVLSSHHCVVKSVPAPSNVPHVCYCHTPMRYAWHMREIYLESLRPMLRSFAALLLDRLRDWDRHTAGRVTHFVANSQTVRKRIQEAYGRDAVVVYPPVDVDYFAPARVPRENYYLVVSALVPYKRVDLAVEACRRLDRPLYVIGAGETLHRLRALSGPKTTFAGWQSRATIRAHLQRCRALLFPGEEDFGIVPVEANSCGTPVICLGRGGATETIVSLDNRLASAPTGVWFEEDNVDAMCNAIKILDRAPNAISAAACRRQAERFGRSRFELEMKTLVDGVLAGHAPCERPDRQRILPIAA